MILQPALSIDVDTFIPHEDDFAEAEAMGVHWRENLQKATEEGCLALCNRKGDVLALGGNMGDQCWFVTDTSVEHLTRKDRLAFRKVICEYRDWLLKDYPVLWNYVWVGNKNHQRFLRSIGATFHEEFTTSPLTGERFQLFTISL